MDIDTRPPALDGGSEHHEDDDIHSTSAVHAASPRPNASFIHGDPDEPSDDDFPASDADVGSIDPLQAPQSKRTVASTTQDPDDRNDADDEAEAHTSPAQLSLNTLNLQTFEASAKHGNIPLRTDMLGPRHAMPAKKTTASSSLFVNSGIDDGSPLRSVTHPQSPLSRRDVSRSTTLMDKMSVASVDCEVGSTVPMRDGDDLNVENLREHMRELHSGKPLPLHAENIVEIRPRRTRSPRSERRDDLSVLVEPSEADAPSITSSAIGVHEASQRARRELPTSVRGGDGATIGNVEDLWSIASTGDHDHSFLSSWGGDSASVYHDMLSTESLVQLRRQLESGDTPLRPEMLYGFIRAIGQGGATHVGVSPSMVVEAPTDDRGAFNASPHSPHHHRTLTSPDHPAEPGYRLTELAPTDGETDRAERGSNSPRVLGTEQGDDLDDEDVREALRTGRAVRDDDNSSVPDHNESLLLTDGENYTEDTEEVGISKEQVRELWRAIVELKSERRQLEGKFAETSRKLDTMDAHSQQLLTDTQAAITRRLDAAVQAIESRLSTQLQDAIRALQTVLSGALAAEASTTAATSGAGAGSATSDAPVTHVPSSTEQTLRTSPAAQRVMSPAPTTRLLMQVSPSLLLQNGSTSPAEAGKPLEFIVPVPTTATIGEAKSKFVSRLQQVGVLTRATVVTSVVLRYKGRHVFDEDPLTEVIDVDVAATSSTSDAGDAYLFVLDGLPSPE